MGDIADRLRAAAAPKMAEADRLRAEAAQMLADADAVAVLEAPPPPAPVPTPPPAPEPPPVDPPPPADAIVLRQIDLGAVGPYVSSVEPVDTGEDGGYNRKDVLALFYVRSARWGWRFAEKQEPDPLPRLRMLIDGEPVSEWQAADADGAHRFDVALPPGHHLAHVEAESVPIRCLGVPFLVNDTGARLPDAMQTPWMATKRFDADSGVACVAVQMRWPSSLPPVPTRPLKDRQALHYRERMPLSRVWGRHCTANTYRPMSRQWSIAPTGDQIIEVEQKYFHSDAIDNHTEPRQSPVLALYDGPRGVGTLGYVCDMRIREDGGSLYFLETSGRLGRLRFSDGDILTELGPRLTPGKRKVHSDVLERKGMYYGTPKDAEHQAAYHAQWEQYGDWTQVQGAHVLWEPWGFATAMRLPDGSMTVRDGHELWICDTRHNRIVYADHWTAHAPDQFEPAHFPPRGYAQASGPTGTTTVANFVGNLDGTPTEACNEPWQCKVSPFDGLLYWTNFQGDSIYRCNLDGTGVEPVFVSSLRPTDADLTVRSRLDQSDAEPSELRERWLIDGAHGFASLVRPMAFDFDSQGDIVVIERYTYAIRRLDLKTSVITTLASLLDRNGGSASSGNNEPVLVVDSQGTCGPVDDIFVQAWSNQTDRRFDRDGNRVEWAGSGPGRGAIFTRGGNGELPNGPAGFLQPPNYAWGLDVWGGRIVGAGNAAGSQFVELTLARGDEPRFDQATWRRGMAAFNASGAGPLIHGTSGGQGMLGNPTWESMVGWTDAEIDAEMLRVGVDAEALGDVRYCVRWVGQEHD